MFWNNALTELQNVLAELYSDEESSRRVADEAGLNNQQIPFNSAAANNWHAILLQANKEEALEAVIGVALKEFPRNQPLLSAVELYRQLPQRYLTETERRIHLKPVPDSSDFVGRLRALKRYRECLAEEGFVVITGPSGMGKTSCAAKLARDVETDLDRIFWFSFTPGSEQTIRGLLRGLGEFLAADGVLGLQKQLQLLDSNQHDRDLDGLLDLAMGDLARGAYLIVLDNFNVVELDPELEPTLRYLQEHYPCPSGRLPARFIIIGREVHPIIEHFSSILRGFDLADCRDFLESLGFSSPEANDVDLLWRLTGGNPELLRLSVRHWQEEEVSPDELKQLAEAGDMLPDIGNYLEYYIFDDLSPQQQELLEALSIFPGSIVRETAVEILRSAGVQGVAGGLDTLENKGIIVAEASIKGISLPGLVRDYWHARLEIEDRERFHGTAARHFEEGQDWLLAVYHWYEANDRIRGLTLLTKHAEDIISNGQADDLLQQLNRLEHSDLNLSAEQTAVFYQTKGDAFRVIGEYDKALDAYDRSLRRSASEKRAILHYRMGRTHSMRGDYEQAIRELKHAARESHQQNDVHTEARSLCALGWALYRAGQDAAARKQFTSSERKALILGNERLLARVWLGLGLLALRAGQLKSAGNLLEDSRETFHRCGDTAGEVQAMINLGILCGQQNHPEEELIYYTDAVRLNEILGDVHNMLVLYNNLGNLYYLMNDLPNATIYYEKLRDKAEQVRHIPMLSTAYSGLADIFLQQGNYIAAMDDARQALAQANLSKSGVEIAIAHRVLGDAWLASGDAAQAAREFDESIKLLTQLDEPEELEKGMQGRQKTLARLGLDSLQQ